MDYGLHWLAGNLSRYAVSHFAKTLLWVTLELYALFSLTELLHLQPALAASCFLALLIWSAACDVSIGRAIDRYVHPRSATRLMRLAGLAASVAFAISLVPWLPGQSGTMLSLIRPSRSGTSASSLSDLFDAVLHTGRLRRPPVPLLSH